ncbi:GNAT family N-acetyltransferase [Candidatus Shapirobacteria bacterium]|nr:GNAT family N-acetyltransferase [Candidatus Shapirobacteria bacterium]
MLIRNVDKNDFESIKEIKPVIDSVTFDDRILRQAKGDVDFLVLEDNGDLKCFVLLKWKGKDTHPEYPDIEDLYTKASERGKKYGSTLIAECEKMVREKGFNKIGLAVNPNENCSAHKLYKRLGFNDTGEKTYIDGVYNGVEDWCIDMEKSI